MGSTLRHVLASSGLEGFEHLQGLCGGKGKLFVSGMAMSASAPMGWLDDGGVV